MTITKHVTASTERYGLEGFNACDNLIRTRWEAEPDDPAPWLEIDLISVFTVSALRILWAEPGLDYDKGFFPGPFQYKLLVSATEDGEDWQLVLDRSKNDEDLLIDYQTFPSTQARRIKLEITATPEGIRPSIISLTVFGTSSSTA